MLNEATNLSFSRIGILSTCRQKYHHKYVLHSQRLEPVGDYFRVGKVVDMCLLYAKGAEGMPIDSMFRANAEDFYLQEGQDPREIFLEEKWYHYCAGLWDARERLYDEIFKDFPDVELQSFLEIVLFDKETGEVIADDEGRSIPWAQYLDAWSALKNTILEVKTYSGNLEQVFLEHEFKGQTQIYAESKKRETGSIPDVLYAYIKKPQLRKKKDESDEDFYNRMYEAGIEATVEFKEAHYTEAELDETMKYYYDFVNAHLHAGPVRDRNACYQFGRPCEYLGHCWRHQHKKEIEEAA